MTGTFLPDCSPGSKGPHSASAEALPGLPPLLQEASQSRRKLSKLLGAVELDVRQVHSFVVSESWQKKRTEQEEVSLKLQHEGQGFIAAMC